LTINNAETCILLWAANIEKIEMRYGGCVI
jgi:hypothetical protein